MFKKKSKTTAITSPKPTAPSTELTALIEKLQKNADKVQKNIFDVEQNLNKDVSKINEGKQPLYQEDTNKRILNSLELLSGLDEDAVNAKRLQHPQAEMIEQDMKQLRDRVMKLREDHDHIYHLSRTEGRPSINWGNIIDEKLDNLNNKGFGQDLPSVENEVEEHNIFHSEVEALAPHINSSGDKDYVSSLQMKYNKLLAGSSARQRNLLSLRDYMQRCTNELYWMDQQAEERINYDWGDTNLDYPARQRQYENFIGKCLESKEATITKLNDDGEKLIAAEHPGKNVIEAHMEAVHADWKEYLNLLICEENHLKHMDEYNKYHKEARDTQDLLKRLDTELNQKYNPEFKDVYQMEGLIREMDDQAKAIDHFDERVNALQKRSLQVLPLKYRRETPQKLLPIEALCEFDTDEVLRGERYTLLRNNGTKWDVKDAAGHKLTAPAVCFMIPPTDPEAVGTSDNLASQQKAIKQKMATSKGALMKRFEELKKESGAGTDKQEQQCRQLMAGLDKVYSDLDKQEKAIYARVRPPLEQNRPLQDSADRLQDMREIAAAVSKIEPEKSTRVQEAKSFLVSNPNCASASQLSSKVDGTNKKYTKIEDLLKASQDKLKNANQLETSLQNAKTSLSTYENKLAREEVAPADISSLEKTQRELADIASDLRSKRALVAETEQNLRLAKGSCENMATKFQEHCPDIERQEADVQKLNKRLNNLNRQIDTRSQSLQRAKMAYKNYSNDYDNLNSWLSRVPNYEPHETDDSRQVETKLKNQRNLLSDIVRKESDLNNISKNAQLYQQAVKDYENETEKFRSILDLEDGLVPQTYKRSRLESPALTVKGEEAAIEAKFTEVNAVNKQRLQNLEFAQSLLNQQPEIDMIQCANVKTVHAAPGEEPWRIRKQLEEEVQRREQLEKEIELIQTDIYTLEGQKPQDTIVKKELIKKVPDPQLDEEVHKVQQKLSEERRSTHVLENDLEVLKLKLRGLETEVKEGAQQYTVKEVLRIERDRGQEEEVRKLREELDELRRLKLLKDNELIQIQKQVTLLAEEKSKEQEVITEEEVIKVQNDPQLETEYRVLLDRKQKEMDGRKQLEDELLFLQEKLRRLEKEKAMAEEKISIKEVLKVEKDVAFEREVENLRRQYEDEKTKRRSSQREKADLQRKISNLEEEKSKVIIQEKVREIVRPDPKAENEVANLRLELVEHQRRYKDSELQLRSLQDELTMLRNRGPQIEVKEIIKEVIKYKTDPQTERELERLRNEIVDKTHQTEKSEMEIRQLRDEIQRWRDTKPQVQTKEIVNEVLQYREDPKTKEEIETLKRKLADEQKKRLDLERDRSAQEEKIRLRKMDLSQVREKIVQQEVVKMEEDALLRSECDTFVLNIGNEQKQKESLKTELYQLQRQKNDLDLQLEELERERRARRDAELEIQRLRVRLHELELRDKENREKVTVKQKVVLQQDPQQEKEHSILRLQLDEEKHKRTLLEKELNALIQQQIALEKVDVKERVVRTEKVQVERDPEAEIEIENLRRTLEEEKRRRRELDTEFSTLTSRLSEMEFTNTKSSKELDYIRDESSRLQQENHRLQNEIRKLRSEIDITSKETRLITESAPREDGKNLELRLDSLQRELADLRGVTTQKDLEIVKLQKGLTAVRAKKEQRESHLRRSIVVIDPDTGKEMRPEEAYKLGLIDWKMFVNLQSQECDWEEITIKDPSGESSVLHDRKSGKKFSIEEALRLGHITNRQLQQYYNKEISIQEFGVMVSGKKPE
ncbi:Periplakin 190 kDa paraneoplastic pemphigus antigen 195 kDa cornified envelope precursor protein [Collichthys lucidus]|uniref:Periplakin n=1 Tax=Collichthys lucidus TaxID=240159 RepID=A0A4U5VVA5_COLLU|nr:Periplakin 190 kDa paraneoplastic pemphigus antigen 195 kDa cornified envelope precursor protein [Collichthys lucidus]